MPNKRRVVKQVRTLRFDKMVCVQCGSGEEVAVCYACSLEKCLFEKGCNAMTPHKDNRRPPPRRYCKTCDKAKQSPPLKFKQDEKVRFTVSSVKNNSWVHCTSDNGEIYVHDRKNWQQEQTVQQISEEIKKILNVSAVVLLFNGLQLPDDTVIGKKVYPRRGRIFSNDDSCLNGGEQAMYSNVTLSSDATWSLSKLTEEQQNWQPTRNTEVASFWAQSGVAEHASVASFNRVSLQLMALGAPAELLRLTQKAALDEIRHAEVAFFLATKYNGGNSMAPTSFPLPAQMSISNDRLTVAKQTLIEACCEETVSAALCAQMAVNMRGEDSVARCLWNDVVMEECGHAVLAFKTLSWLVSSLDIDERKEIRSAMEAMADMTLDIDPSDPYLSVEEQRHIQTTMLKHVVTPWALETLDHRQLTVPDVEMLSSHVQQVVTSVHNRLFL